MANKFSWDDEGTWPFDAPAYVFLARAIDSLGARTFGSEWTGKEWSARGNLSLPPTIKDASPSEREAANTIAAQYELTLKFPPGEWQREMAACDDDEARSRLRETVVNRAWQQALRACQLDHEARARFLQVALEIREHLAWRRLVAAARDGYGTFAEMDAGRWHNPDMDWIERCHFAFKSGGRWLKLPLFIRRAELDILTAAAPVVAQANDLPAHVESVAQTRPRNTAQQGSIERAVTELWGGQIPLGITIPRRNEQIQSFAKSRNLVVPADRTIARYLRSNK